MPYPDNYRASRSYLEAPGERDWTQAEAEIWATSQALIKALEQCAEAISKLPPIQAQSPALDALLHKAENVLPVLREEIAELRKNEGWINMVIQDEYADRV